MTGNDLYYLEFVIAAMAVFAVTLFFVSRIANKT